MHFRDHPVASILPGEAAQFSALSTFPRRKVAAQPIRYRPSRKNA
jgi:hypothetical protein